MSYAEDVRALYERNASLTGRGPDLSWEDRYVLALDAEVRRLREASAVTAVNFGKAQLEIAKLQTKLARVEATRLCPYCGIAIKTALRDEPQPEREPKLPFNGY